MELLLSALLLASFVASVRILAGEGADLVTGLAALFNVPDLSWPVGVQEDDHAHWRVDGAPGGHAAAAGPVRPDPDVEPELLEGGTAVASLVRVRRR